MALYYISKKIDQKSYSGILVTLLGKKTGSLLVKIIFFLQSYFLIVCFSYVLNDCFNGGFLILENIFRTSFPDLIKSNSCFWIVVLNIIVYPRLLKRKYSDFKCYYMISFIAAFIIIVLISANYLQDIVNDKHENDKNFKMLKSDGLYKSTSLMVFACMCQNNILEIYHEIKFKNSARFKSVIKNNYLGHSYWTFICVFILFIDFTQWIFLSW